jgi:hypothetical protein
MMGARLILTVAIIAAAMRSAGAQASSADGVVALSRGNYQEAVEILEPIAEDWRSQDTVAQFFMAGLYAAGRGVPADPLRACALYARAASDSDSPFGRQAMGLFGAVARQGREFDQECQALARVGFQHGLEPAMFELRPGHLIEWTLAAATVTYEGRRTRHEMPYVESGARVLPLRYTELGTGPARALARHFVEMFMWSPATRSGPWQLRWHIFEIVRDDIVRAGPSEPLMIIDGDNPPSAENFDVREYAVLRVDEDGHAEWAALKGRLRETERIETDAERREVREEARARDAALKATDWSRRYDVNRQPALVYTDADGCGQVQVYGWTADRAEAVVVRAAVPGTGSAQSLAFDLERDQANISVETRLYATPQHQFDFCSDTGSPAGAGSTPPETWRAIAGSVTIDLSAPGVRARNLQRATLLLSNVVFRNNSGKTIRAATPIRLTAIVGGFGG